MTTTEGQRRRAGSSRGDGGSQGTCHVCGRRVTPEPDGTVRIVGLAPREAPRVWVWGPVMVHERCRWDVRTPFDDQTGYLPVDQAVVCN